MELPQSLLKQFSELANSNKKTTSESSAYGTIVRYNEDLYVRLDGSEQITPISTTTDLKPGDRVIVTIKDHSVVVTGNVTSPSVGTSFVDDVNNELRQSLIEHNTELVNTFNAAFDNTLNAYTPKDEFESYKSGAKNELEAELGNILLKIDEEREYSVNIDGRLEEFKQLMADYFQLTDFGLLIANADSPFATLYGSARISFMQNNVEVAYIQHNQLYILKAHFIEGITLGNYDDGSEWAFEVDDYGLGIVWHDSEET